MNKNAKGCRFIIMISKKLIDFLVLYKGYKKIAIDKKIIIFFAILPYFSRISVIYCNKRYAD